MPRAPAKSDQPARAGRGPRERRSDLSGQVVEHVLRASARAERPQQAKDIADALQVPYSTATAALRRLAAARRLVPRYVVNNFRTRHCHEYQVALSLRGGAIANTDKKRRERLAKLPDAGARRDAGKNERFIEELLVSLASSKEYREHLIVTDAVLLHGAPDRDLELNIVTDDGVYSLGCWIRNELSENPCIRAIHTVTVGFRYSRNGYSGQAANHHAIASGSMADAGR